jgi:hypothetical protein
VLGYREMFGVVDEVDPLGPEPSKQNPEQRAAWFAAHDALTGQKPGQVATARVGELWTTRARAGYEREVAWAPPYVADELQRVSIDARQIRSRDEIEAHLPQLLGEVSTLLGKKEGSEAAVGWVLGKIQQAPVSGQVFVRPPTADEVAAELAYLSDVEIGARPNNGAWIRERFGPQGPRSGSPFGYLTSVETVLRWVIGTHRWGEPDPSIPVYEVTGPQLRPREEIQALLAWIQGPESSYTSDRAGDQRYLTGVVESLRWVLGQRRDSPVDHRAGGQPVDAAAVSHEQRAAEEGLTNLTGDDQRRQDEHGHHYLVGAEHALAWLLGQPSFSLPADWPWPGNN